jgi:hypothetical protein
MKTIKFKTGREYTEHGQRISACLLDDGDIVFLDIDRGIDGVIRANGISKEDIECLYFNRTTIMDCYDNGNYAGANLFFASSDRQELMAELATIAKSI